MAVKLDPPLQDYHQAVDPAGSAQHQEKVHRTGTAMNLIRLQRRKRRAVQGWRYKRNTNSTNEEVECHAPKHRVDVSIRHERHTNDKNHHSSDDDFVRLESVRQTSRKRQDECGSDATGK